MVSNTKFKKRQLSLAADPKVQIRREEPPTQTRGGSKTQTEQTNETEIITIMY
jgi:hypothetical protein